MLFSLLEAPPLIIEMDAQAPVSSGLAQRKQPERLFSQAVSPQVRVLKQICDLRAKRHTTATGGASKRKSVHESGRIFVCIIHFSLFIIHYSLTERIFE